MASVLVLATTCAIAAGQEKPAEVALSRLLLDRPRNVHALTPGGLRGDYTNPRQVTLFEENPCVFHLFEDGLNENGDHASDWVIDFNKVTAIAVDLVERPKPDPAVARLYRIAPAKGRAVRVTFSGMPEQRQEVFCAMKMCWGDTLSFLQPEAHLAHARQAASELRALCPGPPPHS